MQLLDFLSNFFTVLCTKDVLGFYIFFLPKSSVNYILCLHVNFKSAEEDYSASENIACTIK